MMTKRFAMLVASAVGVLGSAAEPFACVGSVAVTSCNQTCTSNCYLDANLNCTTGQGITLSSGADLDMCGKSLTCTSLICATKAAVTMTANGSQVSNSNSGSPNFQFSKIQGPWSTGVDCASKGSSKVTGIRFENNYANSVVNCAKIEQNVVINPGGWAFVVTTGVANTDQIVDNYTRGGQSMLLTSSTNFEVAHNLIVMDPGVAARGIDATDASGAFSVNDNVFQGVGTPIEPDAGGTYVRNYCDPYDSNCTSCISSGECEEPEVPFTMP